MHDEELIGAIATSKGGLPFVAVSNANQIVARLEFDLQEHLRLREAVEEFIDSREGVRSVLGRSEDKTRKSC